MPSFYLETLGCRTNLADSQALAARLRSAGLSPVASAAEAGLIVVNTCAVTGRADADARQLVERLRRANPAARLVVTGCLAELESQAIAGWEGVERVVPNRHKGAVGAYLESGAAAIDPAEGTLWGDPDRYPHVAAPGRTRAFLKVQEGCDARCSYCVIPRTRGPMASLGLEAVLAAVRALARDGAREVVLTGIRLGAWGREHGRSLSDLLDALQAMDDGPGRIRLTSIEPNELSPALLDRLAAGGRLAPHLHLPLQSGSDRVLGRMRRPYRAADYARLVEQVAGRLPRAGIGADLIAGFPGERPEDHRATLALVASLPLSYLHVFRYSPRPGTEASRLGEPVEVGEAIARSRELRALGARIEAAFAGRIAGGIETVLTLEPDSRGSSGLTGSFVHVQLDRPMAPNQLVSVRLNGRSHGRVQAEVLEAEGDAA